MVRETGVERVGTEGGVVEDKVDSEVETGAAGTGEEVIAAEAGEIEAEHR